MSSTIKIAELAWHGMAQQVAAMEKGQSFLLPLSSPLTELKSPQNVDLSAYLIESLERE